MGTQNMNFKCWLLLLMVMDQRVLLRWKGQWKMVCDRMIILLLYLWFVVQCVHQECACKLLLSKSLSVNFLKNLKT